MRAWGSGALAGSPAGRTLRAWRFLLQPAAQKLTNGAAEMGNLVGAFLEDNIGAGIAFVEPQGIDEAGQQDYWGNYFTGTDLGNELDTGHHGELVVRNNHIETRINQTIEGILRAGNRSDTIPLLLEYRFPSFQTKVVVVDEEQVRMSDRSGNGGRRHSGKEISSRSVRLSTHL